MASPTTYACLLSSLTGLVPPALWVTVLLLLTTVCILRHPHMPASPCSVSHQSQNMVSQVYKTPPTPQPLVINDCFKAG